MRTLNVLVSLIFVMVGIHGWFSFIPAHDPGRVKLTELLMAELRGEERWLLKKEMVTACMLAIFFACVAVQVCNPH